MDVDERKKRIQTLLERQKLKNNKTLYSSFFEECLIILGNEVIVFSQEKSEEIYRKFEEEYSFTPYGRIDWKNDEYHETTIEELNKSFYDEAERCLVIWSHGTDPVIEAKIIEIINNIDSLTMVSPDVWLYKEKDYVIELFHDGIIRKAYKYV